MSGLQSRVERVESEMMNPKSKRDNRLMERIRAARRLCGIPEASQLSPEVLEATNSMDIAQRLLYFRTVWA